MEISYSPSTALNASWYDSKIEMLIITPDFIGKQNYIDAVTPLMNWKNQKGVKTIILSNYTAYPGYDPQEQIRNMIKSYYETENIKWVLLAADEDIWPGIPGIPTRWVYNPDTVRNDAFEESGYNESIKPTDFYYADLTGEWDEDGDHFWGEAAKDNTNGVDEIDWTPEVYVGRLPASTSTELEDMVNKILTYEKNPSVGDWMNRMLLAGAVSDVVNTNPSSPDYDLDGEDESRLTTYIIQNQLSSGMDYKHLYQSTFFDVPNPKELLTASNFDSYFDSGYSTVLFAGHGAPDAFSCREIGDIYSSTKANSASNANKPSLVYSDACTTAPFESTDTNIGEYLIKNTNGGAIGYIGATRVTWYITDDPELKVLNRGCAKFFWHEFYVNQKFQQGRALYDSKVSYMNSTSSYISMEFDAQRKNILTYNLLGDPELDIYTDLPQSVVNPFPANIYEGQLVSVQLVPYASVHLTTFDGMYHTAHADENGTAKFRLPRGAGIIYNVTITGHNYIPTNFSFTTLQDNTAPTPDFSCTPKVPSTFDTMCFNAFTDEEMSGIESIYMFTSLDGFDNYATFSLTNNFLENVSNIEIDLNKFSPGLYEYSVYIIARDYANNTKSFTHYFNISISLTVTDFLLVSASIIIVGVAGLSILSIRKGTKNYSRFLRENIGSY